MLNFLTDGKTADESNRSHFHIKSMKTSRGFTQPNRILSVLRFGGGLIFISAALAMAFVAVNPSGPLLVGKSDGKNQAIGKAEQDRNQWLRNKLALPGLEREGGPTAAAEEAYAIRAAG